MWAKIAVRTENGKRQSPYPLRSSFHQPVNFATPEYNVLYTEAMKEIYLDHASTTYTDHQVLEAMMPYFSEKYGNPESLHSKGKEALIATDNARETVAKILNCRPSEIIFTGSCTEANNLAIFGIARASKEKGKHLITSAIEHSSVRMPFQKLEQEGYAVTYIQANNEGFINPQDIEVAINPKTALVSIMHANNEIGTIQQIKEIGEICKKHNIPFHTDAAQTASSLSLDTQALNVDSLSLNASKIYGPKGVGALYIKKGTPIEAIIYGGTHEFNLRAGTHNTAGIIGLAKALELAQAHKEEENKRLNTLQDLLITGILNNIPNSTLNGPRENRLPNNISITIPNINSQELMLHLDEAGICISSGAACNIGTAKPSPTLIAIGLSKDELHSSIRLSLGKINTEEDINYTIEKLTTICHHLRPQNRRH